MAAGGEVRVMENLGVRRPGVGCIAWLGIWDMKYGILVAAIKRLKPKTLLRILNPKLALIQLVNQSVVDEVKFEELVLLPLKGN